ncbi:MAG: hypothetical protein ABIY52_16505 [Gemmatimonadaceae bacterium]
MGRKIGGVVLLIVSALMLLGFMRSGASLFSPTAMFAVLLSVGLPAIAGFTLLRSSLKGSPRKRMELLRQQTIEAEILKLAMLHQGRLTAVEVESVLALPAGEAKAMLDALVLREVADLEVTDDGVLVYTFHDARYLGGKNDAAGLLDA